MKTRMEKYFNEQDSVARSAKNKGLYEKLDNSTPSSKVNLFDNVSEIDMSKIKDLFNSREGYKRIKNYEDIIDKKQDSDEPSDYDIYEDIEDKIYDINSILEEARKKRSVSDEREKQRKLRNTQYNILTNLELNKVDEIEGVEDKTEEVETDFFTRDKEITKLIESVKKKYDEETDGDNQEETELTSTDLFANLKSMENTVLTEPIDSEELSEKKDELPEEECNEENTFYTNMLSFTKEDFEEIHNLQSTVKSNNRLIKVLIFVLIMVILAIAAFIVMRLI